MQTICTTYLNYSLTHSIWFDNLSKIGVSTWCIPHWLQLKNKKIDKHINTNVTHVTVYYVTPCLTISPTDASSLDTIVHIVRISNNSNFCHCYYYDVIKNNNCAVVDSKLIVLFLTTQLDIIWRINVTSINFEYKLNL